MSASWQPVRAARGEAGRELAMVQWQWKERLQDGDMGCARRVFPEIEENELCTMADFCLRGWLAERRPYLAENALVETLAGCQRGDADRQELSVHQWRVVGVKEGKESKTE